MKLYTKTIRRTFKVRKEKSISPTYRIPHLYFLPKIHKRNNPGRPVISLSSSHAEKMPAFVDNHIKPIAQKGFVVIEGTGSLY